ncbi:MAG: hypothetical protein HFE85_02220, partial [Clostridiales bacterium]|nr:hypothetical protein [Clostridiales bacterium]
VTNGVLNEAGPAYKAMVIDNETAISKDYMQKLVEFADAGLKLVFANDLPCISTSINDDNAEIAAMMDKLLANKNVVHVKDSSGVADALSQLGVTPDAAKASAEANILPIHRVMNDGNIYFLYNQSEEETTATVTLKGEGAPFLLNSWTGDVEPIAQYTTDGESVTMTVTLAGRDAVLLGIGDAFGTAPAAYAKDSTAKVVYRDGNLVARISENGLYAVQTNDGKPHSGAVNDLPAAITINDWDLKVESWTSGDADDAAVTKKEVIFDGHTDAVSWKEIEGLGDAISGIGTYTATFTLDDVTDLGAMLSFSAVGETFKVTLNGKQVPFGNQVTKEIDLGGYLQKGENTLVVEVASSLQNAANLMLGKAGEKDYGIIGAVTITPYREVVIAEAPGVNPDDSSKPDVSDPDSSTPDSSDPDASAPDTGVEDMTIVALALMLGAAAAVLVTKRRSPAK